MLEITQDSAQAAPFPSVETAVRTGAAAKTAVQSEAVQNEALAALEAPLAAEGAAENALRLAGLRLTPENRALVTALLLNGLSADKNTLVQMNRAMKLTENDLEKALFLIKNELRPTRANVTALDAFASGGSKLGAQLQQLLAVAEALPEGAAKQDVLRILTGTGEAPLAEKAMDALFRPVLNVPVVNTQPEAASLDLAHIPPPQAPTTALQLTGQGTATPILAQAAESIATAMPALKEQFAQVFTQALSAGEEMDLPRAEALIRQTTGQMLLPEGERDSAFTRAAVRFMLAETAEAMPAREREVLQRLVEPAAKKLIFPHREGRREDIDRFLTDLRVTLAEAKEALSSRGVVNDTFSRAVDIAENGVRFLQDMRNAVVVQLPVLINQQAATAELYVFRDKRKKTAKNGAATALLALNELHLGRVEAYIRREGQAVSCQFRLGEKRTEALVRAEIHRLSARLAEVGFRLESVTYQALDEPFGILDSEPSVGNRDDGDIVPYKHYTGLDEKV